VAIQYTTNYHIAYMDDQTALADLDTVTQQVAQSLDTAMGQAGYTPPDATTFAALAARVTALEGLHTAAYAKLRGGTSGSISTASGVWSEVPCAVEEEDGLNGHSTAALTERWVCPAGEGGLYLCAGSVQFASNATGKRWAAVRKNAADYLPAHGVMAPGATAGTVNVASAVSLYRLAPGDYLSLWASQDAGAALAVNLANTGWWLSRVSK
jgi:hypothetical protein